MLEGDSGQAGGTAAVDGWVLSRELDVTPHLMSVDIAIKYPVTAPVSVKMEIYQTSKSTGTGVSESEYRYQAFSNE